MHCMKSLNGLECLNCSCVFSVGGSCVLVPEPQHLTTHSLGMSFSSMHSLGMSFSSVHSLGMSFSSMHSLGVSFSSMHSFDQTCVFSAKVQSLCWSVKPSALQALTGPEL